MPKYKRIAITAEIIDAITAAMSKADALSFCFFIFLLFIFLCSSYFSNFITPAITTIINPAKTNFLGLKSIIVLIMILPFLF